MPTKNNHTFIIIFIAIIIVIGVYIFLQTKNLSSLPVIVKIDNLVSDVSRVAGINKVKNLDGWNVGVWTNVFAANPGEKFDQTVFDKQIKDLKDLGINHLRTNFEKNGHTPISWANDLMVKAARDNAWRLTFIVEHPFKDFFSEANYENGYEWGKKVGSSYPGKVDYYQLANEVSGSVISSGNGLKKEDYDSQKYEILKDYLLGLRDGIHKTDPKAKFILSAHWICLAVIDMLIGDGLEVDVIGWNWYSEMGDDLTHKPIDEGAPLDIPGHFAKYGKPFWIVEVNQSGGDTQGEEKQVEFLKNLINNSYNSEKISGMFVYKFVDSICTEGDKPTSHLGIVKDKSSQITKSDCDIADPKDAYYVLKDFIDKLAQ